MVKKQRLEGRLFSFGMRRSKTIILGILLSFLFIAMAIAAPTDLIISEYIEGSSNNKAIEIFNGTGSDIDLTSGNYVLAFYNNGNTTVSTQITLDGTLSDEDVYVLAHSSATLSDIVNELDKASGSWYNGNDAIILWKSGVDGTIVDSIGQVGNGDDYAKDVTFIRKDTVCEGDTDPDDAFDPSIEWDTTSQDDTTDLGSHSINCSGSGNPPPSVSSTLPDNGDASVFINTNIEINFNEDVNLTANWVEVIGSVSGTRSIGSGITVSGGPSNFILNPDTDFSEGETVTVTIFAAQVSDLDNTNMTNDEIVQFTTFNSDNILKIHTIQGAGDETPEDGNIVTIEGIVTSVFQGADTLGGFFVQEEDADIDLDDLTSEGIFIYHNTPVNAGDKVQVTGMADENYDNTQIKNATVNIVSSGNTLPATVDVTMPFSSETYLERYEGMRIRLNQTLYVTNTYSLSRYGEIVLSSGDRLQQPTNVAVPGDDANALQAENDLNRILLDDGYSAQNIDPTPYGLTAANTIRGGDSISGLTGPIYYSYSKYRVEVDSSSVSFTASNPRPTTPIVGGSIKVASFNVLNYFTTFDDQGDICGPSADMGCRGADNAEEFSRQRDKIIRAIVSIDADILGLMEVENTTASSGLEDLVSGLNDLAGDGTYDYVDTDTIGSDAIRVGFIYQPATISLVGTHAILDDSVDSTFNDSKNRPSLAQTFEEIASGEIFTVVVNHFKSKGSDCDALNDPDNNDGQGNCNLTRLGASTALNNWLLTDPTGSGDADFLLIGDFNAYAKEDPITALETAGYFNEASGYSFSYDGQWGSLDHVLSSENLHNQIVGSAKWHINADEPVALDYNTNYKSTSQIDDLYQADAFRSSDHDPIIVGLDLNSGSSNPMEDLIISQYIEGSGVNKAIEIFNGTGTDIDMASENYVLAIYTHGNTSAQAEISLEGTIANGDVFVLANPNADLSGILNEQDQTSDNVSHNGNDVYILWKSGVDGTIVDSIGQRGNSDNYAADQTLTRKDAICEGDTDPDDTFDPSIEWDSSAKDDTTGLGSHSATCSSGGGDVDPFVSSISPDNGDTGVPIDSNIEVNFNEDVTVNGNWAVLTGTISGTQSVGAGTLAVSGGPKNYILNPDQDFSEGETVTVSIFAEQVSDLSDTNLKANKTIHFTAFDPSGMLKIHDIQGSGDETPEDGNIVTIEGIVTSVFQGTDTLGGFFVQEEDADIDADDLTSEGIFIYNDTPVNVGDKVQVTGTADENYENTQIKDATVNIISSGNPLPAALNVTLPFSSENYLERFEGMRIKFNQTLYVTNTYYLSRYGEIELSSGGRLQQPTNVEAPGADANALQEQNDLNRILVDDGYSAQNMDPTPYGLTAEDTIRGGDTITDLTGPIFYSYDRYRVEVDSSTIEFTQNNPRPETPPVVGGSIKVASFNVLNYFSTFDDQGSICSPSGNMECRGADNAEEFNRQRDKIIEAILSIDADILGLMEVENTEASSGLEDLVSGLNDIAGPGTYDYVDTDTIGSDAIRVGFIYQPATTNLVGSHAILDDSVDPTFNDSKNRPSLAQTFEEIASGEIFTVVVNHFKSKGSSCDSLGDPDAEDGQANCNLTRLDAAIALDNWLQSDPTGSGDTDYLLIGDFNAYAKEDPIAALEAEGYFNEASGYSFSFKGQWGSLDHILSSESLHQQVAGADKWHINSDEPVALDYNMNYKSTSQIESLYEADAYRSSDHDPIIVGLNLSSNTAPFVSTISPDDGDSGVDVNSNIEVNFNKDVNFEGNWAEVVGSISGIQSVGAGLTFTGGPKIFILNPDTDFSEGEAVTVTIFAAQVSDLVDGTNMTDDEIIRFTTFNPDNYELNFEIPYNGTQSGTLHVWAYDPDSPSIHIGEEEVDVQPGTFVEIPLSLPNGDYYLKGFVDTNDNNVMDNDEARFDYTDTLIGIRNEDYDEKITGLPIEDPDGLKSQIVFTDPVQPKAIAGGKMTFDLKYTTSDNNNQLTGLGIRIHYDSNFFDIHNSSIINRISGLAGDPLIKDEDFDDGDSNTDKVLVLFWSDPKWPNEALPVSLCTLTFDVNDECERGEESSINITSSTNTFGYLFYAAPIQLEIMTFCLDIDGNGQEDALTDGLLILRYLAGLNQGESLIGGAIAQDAIRKEWEEIADYISSGYSLLDVDGNNETDALTDGLLILRYLAGLNQGSSLTENAVDTFDGTRITWEVIADYIESLRCQ
jgi:hypothetical protein